MAAAITSGTASSGIQASTTSRTGSSGTSVFSKPQETFFDHVSNWFATSKGERDFFKAVKCYFDWFKVTGRELSPLSQNIHWAATDMKRIMGGISFIPKCNEIRHEFRKWRAGEAGGSATNFFFTTLSGTGDVWDGVEFFHYKKLLPISHETFQIGARINGAALAIGMTRNTYRDGKAFLGNVVTVIQGKYSSAPGNAAATSEQRKKINDAGNTAIKKFMDTVKNASYLVLGILTAFAIAAAPWVFVALSTSTVVCGILGHFTGKMLNVDPKA